MYSEKAPSPVAGFVIDISYPLHRVRHGIVFEDAAQIFDGPTVEKFDDRFDYGETRVFAVNGLEITVVYTDENDEERRIISAWRSELHERRSYWQNIEG